LIYKERYDAVINIAPNIAQQCANILKLIDSSEKNRAEICIKAEILCYYISKYIIKYI